MVWAIDERAEEYRREAAAARDRAASNPAKRSEFLHVAESWAALAREVERLDEASRQGKESVRI